MNSLVRFSILAAVSAVALTACQNNPTVVAPTVNISSPSDTCYRTTVSPCKSR